MPLLLSNILNREKGSKIMYNILNNSKKELKCEKIWTNKFDKEYDWKMIHTLLFKTTRSSKLQWFQFRIIHRIQVTN